MNLHRRGMLGAGLGLGLGLTAAASPAGATGPRRSRDAAVGGTERGINGRDLGLVPDAPGDQTAIFQAAVDRAAERQLALVLLPGRYRLGAVQLRPRSALTAAPGAAAHLAFVGGGRFLWAADADRISLSRLVIDGSGHAPAPGSGLVAIARGKHLEISALAITGSGGDGLVLEGCAGRVRDCTITGMRGAGLRSLDAAGLEISHNHIADCADNGVLVWRSVAGEDATMVTANRIERIGAASGGSGQYGNGINVFRAGSVLVSDNRIADCAYTAIRGNQASNVQMIANSVQRIGEVALYAEFAFEGALIASNLVDTAATGISVTNFNEGGRLAVVQGNLVRNLVRREHEPVDKRGEGIAVEADAAVTGNVIENAASAGIQIGWGHHMRDCIASGNVIRNARVGIAITSDPAAGSCLVSGNMISGARDGAIRAMSHGTPIGPDLTRQPTASTRVVIGGNVAS